MSKGKQREQRMCRAIRLLADGHSTRDVAHTVRVLPATLDRWQTWPEFRALLRCLQDAQRMRDALDRLNDLTPGAVEVLRRALEDDDTRVAIRAAHEVLDRVWSLSKHPTEQTIRVEYGSRDSQPVSTAPWADRHPAPSGTLQSGCVREALREDGDGQDSAD
jgi:hypothetical protein